MRPPRLRSVAGTAFGSFVAPFEVKFPETGLVHLRGENLDTKGSSASGKSTFIHALNYPLGTCPVPLTALQSWYTKDSPKVTNTYDVDGKIVKISRGKRFLLEIDGAPFDGSADQKEEKIDELFGTNAEMRLALTYRGQRKPGLFLSKTDKKQKEFLTKLLNLDKFDEEQKKALAKVKELEDRYNILYARLQDNATSLESLMSLGDGAEAEASLALVVKEIGEHESLQRKYEKTVKDMNHDAEIVHQFALDLFKPKLAEADARIQELERVTVLAPAMTPEWEKLKALQVGVQTRLDRLVREDFDQMKDMLAQAEALRAEWQALALQAAGEHKLLADRDRVVADIQELVKNVCPTCKREWEEAKLQLEDLKVELEQINAEALELKYIREQAVQLKEEYDALPKSIEPNPMIAQMRVVLEKCQQDAAAEEARATAGANASIQENAKLLKEARTARQEMNYKAYNVAAKKRDEVLAGVTQLEALARQEKDAKVQKELARQKLAEEVGGIRERRRQIAQAEKKAGEMAEELGPLQVQLAAEKDFAHLTGREAFRGSVFDEALEAISEETNAMLASIANTRNCTLRFESENETQDGKLRQEITPVITINGHKAHSLDWGPSGGMLSAIELAVDLAVGKIIAERTGVCPGWLILDESFDGLGPREKDTCLEMLQLYAADRLVIIVDHTSETQGFFTKHVTVQSQGGISTIRA
jgi:DNA repair exonuclease SbcCD ATPase subunit